MWLRTCLTKSLVAFDVSCVGLEVVARVLQKGEVGCANVL